MTDDGTLLYGFNRDRQPYFARTYRFGLRLCQRPIDVKQQTESALVPIVKTAIRYPTATLELLTFAHQHDGDRRTDIVIWTIRVPERMDEVLARVYIEPQEIGLRFVATNTPAGSYVNTAPAASNPHDEAAMVSVQTLQTNNQPDTPENPLAFFSSPHALDKDTFYAPQIAAALMTYPIIVHH